MKKIVYLMTAVLLFLSGISSLHAQGAEGKEFWLTFGRNQGPIYTNRNLQIRIIGGDVPASGTINFTHLNNSNPFKSVPFNIAARQVYVHNLNDTQIEAALHYNIAMGVTDRSIHITSDTTITVYAMNQALTSTDGTNVLPVNSLGDEYYHISYAPARGFSDAYAVIGTEDHTILYHNGDFIETIHRGQVYYRSSTIDMTGAHITATQPVAFFSVNQLANIPAEFDENSDCLMQQMVPVSDWGRSFFAPASRLGKDIVRIVASQDGTTVTQKDGKFLFPAGGHTSLKDMDAGQFVELEIDASKGCYIFADKPIGICTYLTAGRYNDPSPNRISDPSQCWLLPLDLASNEAIISPFIPSGSTRLRTHHALVVTATDPTNPTEVFIDNGPAQSLSGGSWTDDIASGISFYDMPLTDPTRVHRFTNPNGLIVMCYATGVDESYYFNAYATQYEPDAIFFANEIPYYNLSPYVFCTRDTIDFRAVIKDGKNWEWFIDGIEEVGARNLLTWIKTDLSVGKHDVKLRVSFGDGTIDSLENVVNIGVQISAAATPTQGGGIVGDGCYKKGEPVNLIAVANTGYKFVKWTEGGNDVFPAPDSSYAFTASEPRTLEAHFTKQTYKVTVLCNPPNGGTVDINNDGNILYQDTATVLAKPAPGYKFKNWRDDEGNRFEDNPYKFEVLRACTIEANFETTTYNISISVNPSGSGTVSGQGNFSLNEEVKLLATPNFGYSFINWTENGTSDTITANPYVFPAAKDRILVANFKTVSCTLTVNVNNSDYGSATEGRTYNAFDTVRVEAFVNRCYQFNNWTVDDVEVSSNKFYTFIIKGDVDLTANFAAIDFEEHAVILWNNTIMLNLKQLEKYGYKVIGCRWFKNGKVIEDTRTINEFSYSAGPHISDTLELAYYKFELITANRDTLCSTEKLHTGGNTSSGAKTNHQLWVYPNPVSLGNSFIVEGVRKDSPVHVYNQYGVCVSSTVATGTTITLTLHLPVGVYFIRADHKEGKVVIIK